MKYSKLFLAWSPRKSIVLSIRLYFSRARGRVVAWAVEIRVALPISDFQASYCRLSVEEFRDNVKRVTNGLKRIWARAKKFPIRQDGHPNLNYFVRLRQKFSGNYLLINMADPWPRGLITCFNLSGTATSVISE